MTTTPDPVDVIAGIAIQKVRDGSPIRMLVDRADATVIIEALAAAGLQVLPIVDVALADQLSAAHRRAEHLIAEADEDELPPAASDIVVALSFLAGTASHVIRSAVAAVQDRDRLLAWKAEAIAVLQQWDQVHEALGSPAHLGEAKAEASARRVVALLEGHR